MNPSSVIVFQIDIDGIPIDPTECNSPISTGADRITAFIAANERMKTEPRQVHVLWARSVIKCTQNISYPPRVLHTEPAPVPSREKPFEGLVSERADHTQTVRRWLTVVNSCLTAARK